METNRFVAEAADLQRFEELLERAERLRPSGLRFNELRDLGSLYRMHSARLARLRERGTDPDAIVHHNALSLRAYTLLYVRQPSRSGSHVEAEHVSAALARCWAPFRIAFALLAMGAFLGASLAHRDAQALWMIIPTGMGYTPVMLEELAISTHEQARFLSRSSQSLGERSMFGSMLFANNTRVGVLALAAGMLAGIPTVLMTLYNGLILGAFGSIFVGGPSTLEFFAWILPHGIPEFTAIALCAAGGLLLGSSVAAPGRRTRRQALREAVESALLLFSISIPLFLLAAVIEGFIRESLLSTDARILIAVLDLVLLAVGMAALRRMGRSVATSASWLTELRGEGPPINENRSGRPGTG